MTNASKVLQIATQFKLNEKNPRARKLQKNLVSLILQTPVPGITRPRKSENNYNERIKVYIEKRMWYIINLFAIKNNELPFDFFFMFWVYDDAQNNNQNINQARRNANTAEIVDLIFNTFFKTRSPKDKIAVIKRLPPAVLTAISNNVPNSVKNLVANVSTYMNADMMPVNRSNINSKNLAFIMSNVNNTQKIRTVYNKKGLFKWLSKSNKSPKTQPSPMTRKTFNAGNIMNFPPK